MRYGFHCHPAAVCWQEIREQLLHLRVGRLEVKWSGLLIIAQAAQVNSDNPEMLVVASVERALQRLHLKTDSFANSDRSCVVIFS